MKNDGGPAFPGFQYTEGRGETRQNAAGETEVYATGMTLRDYFAAAALASMIPVYTEANEGGLGSEHSPRNLPILAYRMADAMIAERAK